MTKELKEVIDEIASINEQAKELRSMVENADASELEAIEPKVSEAEARMSELLKRKETLETEEREAQAFEKGDIRAEKIELEERGKEMENVITVASPEYRDAFYAMIAGNETAEQRAVLATPISVDGDGTNDGAAIALPKALDEKIWDNIHTAHPVLGDISYLRTGIVMEVTRHTAMAARVSGKKDAAASAGAEENTFVKVTLAGVDYEKYVELTYAEAKMSKGALEDYLAEEIAAELGEALAKDVFAKMLSDATTAQKVTATSDLFADIKNALGKCAGNPVIYAPSSLYFGIVGAVNTSGAPFNIGNVLGVTVKKDDAATGVTVVDPKMFVMNEIQPIMIESNKDIKLHRVVVSGYLRAEGTMRNTKACAYIA